MDKDFALQTAIELAKIAVQNTNVNIVPHGDYADNVADFIETLANRLEKIGE